MPPSRCGVARSLADQKMDCVGAPGHEQTNEHPTDCLPPTSGHLKFEMRDSFLRLIELMQLQRKDPAAFYSTRDGSKVVKAMKAQHGVSQGRRRPARIPVRALQIGEFKVQDQEKRVLLSAYLNSVYESRLLGQMSLKLSPSSAIKRKNSYGSSAEMGGAQG